MNLLRAIVLSLAVVVPAVAQYNNAGPCTPTKLLSASPLAMPTSTGCSGSLCTVSATVTAPASPGTAACTTQLAGAPAPVVVFFSGFQGTAAQYATYANRLASWGYAVVQYDTGSTLTNSLTDTVELRFLDIILASLAVNPALTGRVNFNSVSVAGHSRGGKLAALHFANSARVPQFVAAYLVDPVDNTAFSPEGPAYPSASKALAALVPRRVAGIAAASITGSCNPAASNYALFYGALAPGTWLSVVQGASHAAFQQSSLGLVTCGFGTRSISTTMGVTATMMTAWMEFQVRQKTPMPSPALQTWINSQVASGIITFGVKP